MKSIGKILGLLFLGLLLIVVALGFALTHLFDPNDYKDEIRQIARDKANLELTLKGDIGWSLFPWLGLELHQATLANAATPDQPFADLDMLGLSVRVMPLLRKEVQMSDIRVEGLKLSLSRDKQGRGNWEDIGRPAKPADSGAAQPQAETPTASEPAEEKPGQPLRLDIDSLIVNNARIDYSDARDGSQLSAESIQLTTGAIREGTNIPVKLTAFLGTNQPLMRAKTELQGELRFDRALKRYQFEDMRLSGEASGQPLEGKTATFVAQGQLLLDQAAQIAEWNGLKLSVNQLRALGELNVRELDKTPKLTGALSIAEFNLRQFLEGLGQKLPAMADGNTLTKVELVSRLNGTPNSLALEELKLKLDDSSFNGRLAVADLAKQALRVQLKGDRLDLDRYLPAKAAKESDAASATRKAEVKSTVTAATTSGTSPLPQAPSQQAWSDAPMLPIDKLRSLDLQLDLGLGQLVIDKLPIDNAILKAQGKGGQLALQDLRGDLYNGNFNAKGSLDVRQAVPQLSIQNRISGVPVEKLIESQGEKSPLTGRLELTTDLRTSGNSQKAWIDALNGTSSFTLNNGVLLDANLEQQLCQGIALLNRKSLGSNPRGKDTPFQELRGNLNFTNGVASNPDLRARIPGLTVNGNGDLDLRVLGMDYRLGIVIEGDKSEMPDPACQVNPRYVGLEWPVRCRGPLELGAKACRLDRDGLGKIAAKLAGDKLTEKLEEKVGDKVSPELKDALKGLFKR
ncbi:AsmA family protein [Zestomonas carbonaria]|uniref:AsmA domain-containing protein n=1 Tax=Zestomonas carbonaria TaxID=2762745 RepID=A0A7U7I773_9GAMM|nr:AsmA family protein [Pseudomonas carbonaria]CAD5105910.1 hypothetical protein PSEWESI4_00169 [Pseudomonas carbonaria]